MRTPSNLKVGDTVFLTANDEGVHYRTSAKVKRLFKQGHTPYALILREGMRVGYEYTVKASILTKANRKREQTYSYYTCIGWWGSDLTRYVTELNRLSARVNQLLMARPRVVTRTVTIDPSYRP